MSNHPVTDQSDDRPAFGRVDFHQRKIVQLMYDHTVLTKRPHFIVLCDDGTIWRQVDRAIEHTVDYGPHKIVDTKYEQVWEQASEFNCIPGI